MIVFVRNLALALLVSLALAAGFTACSDEPAGEAPLGPGSSAPTSQGGALDERGSGTHGLSNN